MDAKDIAIKNLEKKARKQEKEIKRLRRQIKDLEDRQGMISLQFFVTTK